jgi:hypothetical protein
MAGRNVSRLWMAMSYLLTSRVVYLCVKMRLYTDEEWDSLPHVVLTGDGNWNPSVLDHSLTDNEQWYDAVSDFPDAMDGSPFDAEGNYKNLHVFDLFITDSILDKDIILNLPWLYQAHEHQIIKNQKILLRCVPTLPGFLKMLSNKPSRIPHPVCQDANEYSPQEALQKAIPCIECPLP